MRDFKDVKRIILKIGSSSLVDNKLKIKEDVIDKLMSSFKSLLDKNIEICLVTSGAIALGRGELGLEKKPQEMALKQACAAIGQSKLMEYYNEAAYKYGEDWYIELKDYLASNLQYVREFISKKLKGVKLIEPEGTYLIWIDFSGLNITDERLNDIIINKAKLWLDEGNIFGKSGENFERINIACPKAILKEAFERLYKALLEEKII